MYDTLGLIPARGGSKRIPGKNVREVGGKPLIAHTIEQARAAESLTESVVSTDSEEITEVASAHGAKVPFTRPADLARDDSPMSAVVTHALDWYADRGEEFEAVCVLQTTTPLRTSADIDGALERFFESDARSLVSVSEYYHPPELAMSIGEDGYLRERCQPKLLFSERHMRSQDLRRSVRADGCVYVATTDAWREFERFYTPETAYYEIPPERAFDIDEPWELELVDNLI